METIETQTTSQINFDKYEVRGEIYRVKELGKDRLFGVWSDHKICLGVSLSHTNRFGACQKKT